MIQKTKVFAYIDGFNLYHCLKSFIKSNNSQLTNSHKALNVRKLISHFLLANEQLQDIFYFSAIPTHMPEKNQNKHMA